MTLTVAVDGSALGNPGPAGWAWVISESEWDCGGWDHGTNNLGELTAIQQILTATEAAGRADEPLHILADSQYAINVITKWMSGWKKRGWKKADKAPIANLELIQDIDRLIAGRTVTFEWVRGHTGHPMNERADDLARGAATAHQEGRSARRGPGLQAGNTPKSSTTPSEHPISADDNARAEAVPSSMGEEGSTPPAPPVDLSVAEVRSAQKQLISAWLTGDEEGAQQWQSEDFTRIWPGGTRTHSFCGPHPAKVSVGTFSILAAGSALLISYTLTWEGGASSETSVWVPSENGPRIVHHQSSIH